VCILFEWYTFFSPSLSLCVCLCVECDSGCQWLELSVDVDVDSRHVSWNDGVTHRTRCPSDNTLVTLLHSPRTVDLLDGAVGWRHHQ
jgi:hypothetical protein